MYSGERLMAYLDFLIVYQLTNTGLLTCKNLRFTIADNFLKLIYPTTSKYDTVAKKSLFLLENTTH